METISLKDIKSTYSDYRELVEYFGRDVIQSRIDQIFTEMEIFLKTYEYADDVRIDVTALTHAVMDYSSDIRRLKEYQKIDHANQAKIKSYETYWLLKRHPLNIINNVDDDRYTFINEKFLLMRLSCYLMGDKITQSIVDNERETFDTFLEVLLYHLKFRECNAQAIELMILAFEAGKIFG